MMAPDSPTQRTRTANGKIILAGLDGRSAEARRLRELSAALEADLGPDPTEAERLLARSAALAVVHLERLMASLLSGEPVDPEQLSRVQNAAQRALSALRRRKAARKPAADPVGALRAALAARSSEAVT